MNKKAILAAGLATVLIGALFLALNIYPDKFWLEAIRDAQDNQQTCSQQVSGQLKLTSALKDSRVFVQITKDGKILTESEATGSSYQLKFNRPTRDNGPYKIFINVKDSRAQSRDEVLDISGLVCDSVEIVDLEY